MPTPEVISRPEELHLPEAVQEVFASIAPHLSEAGKDALISDLMTAVFESQRTNNLRPLHDAVDAWYRTLLIREETDLLEEESETFEQAMARQPSYTAAQIRERLGV